MLSILDQNAATQAMIAKERRGAARSAQIQTTVEMCQNFGKSISDAILLLMQNFSLTESASRSLVDQYWKV